jgi:hypothetical protein
MPLSGALQRRHWALCFSSIDDPAVFQALLAAAEGWLNPGMRYAVGPISFSMRDEPVSRWKVSTGRPMC